MAYSGVDALRARHGIDRRSFTEVTVIATASESVAARRGQDRQRVAAVELDFPV